MEISQGLTVYFSVITGMTILALLGGGFVLFTIRYQKRLRYQERLLSEQLILHQQDLIKTQVDSSEEERNRIARDLHDDLGGVLAALHLQIHQLSYDGLERIDDCKELVTMGINRVRQISHSLMPPELESFGLCYTLKNYIEKYIQSTGKDITADLSLEEFDLPPNRQLALYRICMELLSNTIKYAQANFLQVQLHQQGSMVQFSYADNGVGMEPDKLKLQRGSGLRNIEGRCISLSGSMQINTSPGNGFSFKVTFYNAKE